MSRKNAYLILTCIALFILSGLIRATAQEPPVIAPPSDPETAWQAIVNAMNAHDVEQFLLYIADDIVFDSVPMPPPLIGKEQVAGLVMSMFQGFPDFHIDLGSILASGNMVVSEYTITGTHQGEWAGIPPTGKSVQVKVLDVMEYEGGKEKHLIEYFDSATWMVQLGVFPAPDPPDPALLVPSFALPDVEPTGLSPLDANTEAYSRFNSHDLENYAKMIHPDAEILIAVTGIPMDRAAYIALHENGYLKMSSDFHGEVTSAVDMGDGWVVSDAIFSGTNDDASELLGFPATGNTFSVRGGVLHRFDEDGLITNLYVYTDNITLLTQLGMFDTQNTLAHHLQAIDAGDIDAIMSDYTEDAVLITPNGVLRGHDNIRPLFETMLAGVLPPGSAFQMVKQIIEGEMAYIVWSAESDDYDIPFGTDTFVVRDRKIVAQTFAALIEAKTGGEAALPTLLELPESAEKDVLMHHLQAIGAGDVDAIMADYAEDAVLFTPNGALHGHNEIRTLFEAMVTGVLPPGSSFVMLQQIIEGEIAYIVWSAESDSYDIPFGTDTFFIHDGKIVTQTFAAQMEAKPPVPTQEEQNKALIASYFEEVWNKGNVDLIEQYISPDFVGHLPEGEAAGIEGDKNHVLLFLGVFPDAQLTINDMTAEEDMVVARWTLNGTHKGPFGDIPATDKKITGTGITIFKIADGKILEAWAYADMLGVMQQMGAITPGRPGPENYLWTEPSTVTGDPGDPATNKAIAMRYAEECWNQGKVDVLDEIFSPDIIFHNPAAQYLYVQGLDDQKKAINDYRTAFPDFHVTTDALVAEGDKVVGRWTATGTHEGELMGIPPSGKKITWSGSTIYRFADGKIVEDWWAYDALGLIQQITALPEPTQEEKNKALERRVFEEIWNQGKLDVADEVSAPDVVMHGLTATDMTGPAAFKQMVAMYRAAFPDLKWTIEDQIAEGDMVTTRLTGTGTHTNQFMNIPATGANIIVTTITTVRIADGKIQESWNNYDALGQMQQLGVISPGRPTPESYMWGEPSTVTGDPGTPEANKVIGMRFAEEFWNQKQVSGLDETHSTDFIGHNPVIPGNPLPFDVYKQVCLAYITTFPDLHVVIDDTIAEGDKIVYRWTATGTHKVEIMGIPATDRKVSWTGMTIYRFADGKIVENWWAWDALGLIQQLTAPPEQPTKDYTNVFFMSLKQGLNMISLPLEPVTPYTAKTFAEHISATMVIRYDESNGIFEGFVPIELAGDGFPIEGGKGYIVNVTEDMVVEFVGAAWTNMPPVAPAPPVQINSVWAFVVNGLLLDGEMIRDGNENYTVKVKNLRTGVIISKTADVENGYFAAVWADLNRKSVIENGDKLEVSVIDSGGKIVSGPFVHEINLNDIRNAVKNVQLRLGNIIPEKSALLQNYPNPFNPETWIPYQLNIANPVLVRIYNTSGQLVKTLDIGYKEAGMYVSRSKAAYWDGKNEAGEEVASGIYFYSVTAGDFSSVRKMVIKK